MMKFLLLAALIPTSLFADDPSALRWAASLQQRALYFSSDRVTMAGIGAGIGAQVTWHKSWIAQADVNILWGNGNALPARLAFGIKRDGRWAPALLGTFSLLWGQRVEILSETGQRPAIPVWVAGILVAPLRFEGTLGYVSALEVGYGIGPDRGRSMELTILATGVNW